MRIHTRSSGCLIASPRRLMQADRLGVDPIDCGQALASLTRRLGWPPGCRSATTLAAELSSSVSCSGQHVRTGELHLRTG